MENSTLLASILVVLCLATMVQGMALVGMFLAVKRLERMALSAERGLDNIRPRLERLGRTLETLADFTDRAAEQAPRVAQNFENAVDRAREAAKMGALLMVKPLRPVVALIAFWRGLRRKRDDLRFGADRGSAEAPALTR